MSTVDIAVPSYKHAHFLGECVRSVLSQEGVQLRVLILDDASPDHTEEVARRLVAQDSRVAYRRHASNQGNIATFNEGIEWATAEYFTVLSADDVLTAGSLRRAVAVMNAEPSVVMTYGRPVRTSDPSRREPVIPEDYSVRITSGAEFWEQSCLAADNLVFTPTVLVRTAIQKEIGGYRAELPYTADLELWLRFAARGSLGFIDPDQAFYRIHGENLTAQFPGAIGIRQLWAAFNVLFSDYGRQMANRAHWEATVMRQLGWNAFWCASEYFDRGDADRCRECTELALSLWPLIRPSAAWHRLQLKRAMGARVWRRLRPLADRLRLRGAAGPSLLDPLHLAGCR